ncbi:MAG: hypothetical protein ACXWC3_06260, partial [Burkholderiales bacterium]
MHLFSGKAVQCVMAALLFLTFASPLPAAQDPIGKWPEKPVRVVVAAAPGSGDDFATRLLAPKLSELL